MRGARGRGHIDIEGLSSREYGKLRRYSYYTRRSVGESSLMWPETGREGNLSPKHQPIPFKKQILLGNRLGTSHNLLISRTKTSNN